MREIVLDTETTGFEPEKGDRIVEIGAVELINHLPTGRTYHQYINPQRSMPEEAFKVHGLGDEFLADKPLFKDIAQDFIDFVGDAKLVIHNAAFDMKFINAELKWQNRPEIPFDRAIDTLAMARQRYPGSPATLDALCRRFNIDNSARTLHGALLDSEILAEVYLEMVGGRQPDFALSDDHMGSHMHGRRVRQSEPLPKRERPLPSRLSAEEDQAHRAFVKTMGDGAFWAPYLSQG